MTIQHINLGIILFIILIIPQIVVRGLGNTCVVDGDCVANSETCIELVCECNISYAEIETTCVKTCPLPPPVENGNGVIISNNETLSFEALYTCTEGHENVGNHILDCDGQGNWMGEDPVCAPIVPPDPCEVNTCPVIAEVQVGCTANVSGSGHVCICPDGFTGADCSITDDPVVCGSRIKNIRFEVNPDVQSRTVCVRKKDINETSACYTGDDTEEIKYSFDPTGYNISVDDRIDKFCLTYLTASDVPTLCINVTAHESNDFNYRPWINSTLEICFIFNKKPRITNIPPEDLRFNVVDMATEATVTLLAANPEEHQTLTWSISKVTPDERSSFISIDGENLIIQNPLDPTTDWTGDIYNTPTIVETTVTDNGMPPMDDVKNFTVVYKYLDFVCTANEDLYLLHLVPLPQSVTQLGSIQCTVNGDPTFNETPTFNITSEPGPFVITSDGGIQYDPNAENNQGTFSITVQGAVTMIGFNLTSDVAFSVVADDLQPSCIETANTATFSEKADVDTCSNVLYTCSDLEGLDKNCTGQSDNFFVTCNVIGSNDIEVLLCVGASIDFMGGSTKMVTFTVQNDYDTVTVSANVTIDNVNDPPVLQLETSPIVLTVPENTTAGGVLVIIPVDDPDMGPVPPLDTLSATLTDLDMSNDGGLPFEVNMSFGNSVSLVLTGPLNGAVRAVYNMSIKVEDSAGLSAAVVVTVVVQDVNEAPVCDPTYITAHATVRDAVDDAVAQLSCSDNDFESPFKDLTYSIQESESAAYFQVDENGAITLKTSLADLTNNLLIFAVVVVDGGGLNTSVTVEVNVTSNYPPICDTSIVSKDVSEKSTPTDCFAVIIPCLDDVDSAGQLEYIVNSGNGSESFNFQDTPLSNQNWSVCPKSDLQGQVGRYIFNGVVRSLYGDTDVQVIINVEDVNDPPVCVDTEVSETVAVTQTPGHVIKSLTCTDLDFTLDFKTLNYSITQDLNGYFAVSTNGVVSLATRLTDITSSGTVLSFNIEVSDEGGLKVTIPGLVTVDASFPPECDLNEVTKSIAENTNTDVCFTIENVCVDTVNNETLSYSVLNGTGTSLFIIKSQESTNEALRVCTKVSLQGNYGNWELNVGVTSSFGQTTVLVIITVIDQNEAPTFVSAPYSVQVLENATLYTVIYTVSAVDPDSGVFGQLTYSSEDMDNSNQFSLDPYTGKIKVISTLDAETSTRYEFNIQVKDQGSPQLSDTTTFVVVIQDINDEKPNCTPTSNSITIHLLSLVGSTVFVVQCTDADITDEFSQIVFSTTSDLFEVDNNGTVTLSSTLPRDQTSHVINIEAGDANKPGNADFITNIVIYVSVDRNAPPVCESTSIFLNLTELETVGKCVDKEITCQDPTNELVTFMAQEGNASNLFEIRTHNNTASLGLNACIKNSLKDQFNTFILIGKISNGLGTTAIRWTITIKNVNEAPVFINGPYSKDLSEATALTQTPVLVITVTDPDDGKGDPNFELLVTSINATVTNDDDYNGMITDAFLFVPSTASFYAIKKFNATVRDLYTFTVTATDNSGLSSTTEVTFNITDENSPPLCDPWSVQANTTILASIGTEVVHVACYDTDIYPQNTALDYQMSSTNSDQYFNVTPDGVIIVNEILPRTLLYDTGHATFRVVVSDRGSPALSASVTVDITVNNGIPAECSPVITPPDVWVQHRCMNITMDCTDPTLEGTDHLSYTPSGNYTNDFELMSNLSGVLTLCYKNTISSIYEISINVNNGLKAAIFTEIIVVSYSKATPVFTQAKYTKTVTENTAAGVPVLSVSATSSNLQGQLVYTVIDAPSTWDTYLSLDSSTGAISTLQPLKSIANTDITLKVEALDTGSQLKSLAQVEITVEDINEEPSCGVTSTSLNNLDVNSDVGTMIVKYNCSDPDVKAEYSSLTFRLSGDSVTTYFKLIGDPPDSIAVKTPLDVSIETYSINLIVQDSGTPPLSVTRVFEVTVSTLPPPVEVVVATKTHTSILIQFNYQREDFYTVTQYFKAKALTVDNELVHESPQLGNTAQMYNITGLEAETAYIVRVEAITNSGTRASKTLVEITKVVPVFSYITFSFVIPKVEFSTRLRDDGSQLYFTNRANVETNLAVVLKSDKGYAGISRMMFRPWNSILVDVMIALNQSADAPSTMVTLNQSVKTGWLNDLSVDSGIFNGSYGAGYITVSDIIQAPTLEIHNGTTVSLECKIETVGYLETDIFTIWWTYRGNVIQPTEQSRYRITTTRETLLYENQLSVLRIDPILTSNAGQYGCHVSDSEQQEEKKFYGVEVIGQPMVIVEPRSQMVQYGDTVNVTCELVLTPGVFEGFVWYRNGEPYVRASNEDLQENGKTSNITVRDITLSVTFGCEGVNQAGASVRAMTTISVIPPDITEDEMCPEVTDRGITWPMSTPGAVIRLSCGTDYTGERYRECDDTGQWKLPVYNCVQNQLLRIEEQVNELKDGASSTTLDEVLEEMETQTADTELYEGDLETAVNTLVTVVDITSSTDKDEIVKEIKNFLKIASHLIDEKNKGPWMVVIEERKEGAIDIARLVDEYLDKKLDNLVTDEEDIYSEKNIYVHVGAIKQATYNFPDRSTQLPTWVGTSGTGLKIPGDAFDDLPTVHYASSFYRDISSILVKKLKVEGNVEDITDKYDINSDIISFQVKEQITQLSTPAEITFQHFKSNYSKPLCTYWDFDEGAFLTDGIVLVSTNDDYTICSSVHFTNFALLMSPGKTPEADLMALSIISAVGCAISILCLVLTIVLYLLVWRHVKSDRAILLLNLCAALIISYVIFLAGINRVENSTICTVISALLHYFYLVVFFLMLAYGIEIAVCVVYVFFTRSRLTWLLPLAWGIPLLIVGISLGATQLEGYGNDRFCWLSTEDGVLWAFVGPAILIIIINFVIVVIVLRQMFKSSAMMTKSDKEKAVTGVRSICVLLPILGLTWIFGVFSVNESLVAFQYIFAICNTLQGFLIFLFHCILNKQLKQALKQRNERKKSMASIENTFKNAQSTTSSGAFYSSDGKSTQQKNNLDSETTETSNPFLQADRQMNALVAKNKTGGNVNEVNNKLDKDIKNKPVDLDDVKISNILRESEVMGGTAGISSILQEQPKDELPSIRESKSSRYEYIDPYGMNRVGYENSAHGSGSAKHSAHSDRSRDRKYELEREREEERLKQVEYEKRDRQERDRKEREKREREKIERDRERQEHERKDREKREKEKHKNKNVIKIGYGSDTYLGGAAKSRDHSHERRDHSHERRDHSHERRGPQRPQGPSRADDDYEKEAKKQAESLQKKKEKKKSSLKERSAPYEYSYESTYLGGNSRHASLENMNAQQYVYSPYAQMPGMGGYQTGRPTHQQQHWDQYRYPRDPRDPYGRDHW